MNQQISRKRLSKGETCLLAQLRRIPAANVADALGDRISVLDAGFCPINDSLLLGTAFPVECPPGDNLTFHCALELAQPGDVIVVSNAGGMKRALCGEMMARYARSCGMAGFVVDGCIRDQAVLANYHDFAVYAKGSVPAGPDKERLGKVNCPVVLGSCTVHPGDILLGDRDGVLVIPRSLLAEAVEKGRIAVEREEKILMGIANGQGFPRPFLEQALERLILEENCR